MTDKNVKQWHEYDILGEDACKLFGFENTFSLVVWIKIEIQKYNRVSRNTTELKQYGTCNCAKVNTTAYWGKKKKRRFMWYKRPECKLHNSAGRRHAPRYFYWLRDGVRVCCSSPPVSRGYLLPHQRMAAQRPFTSIVKKACGGKKAKVQHWIVHQS